MIGSKDGSLRGERLGPHDKQQVTFITTNPDFVYATPFPSPRFGPKVVQRCVETIYKELYGRDLVVEEYGKPYPANFKFVKSSLETVAKRRNIKISNFYMIGDNPESDICGGNSAGWVTILVKTGVFDEKAATSRNGNDINNPAKYVVDDFAAAISLIYRLEGLN